MEYTPQKLRIINATYTIEYQEKPVAITEDGVVMGDINYWDRHIRIAENGRDSRDVMQTLWHEILHGICEQINITTQGGLLGEDEDALDQIATGIVAVLVDNHNEQ